ncbi:hypothetical protein TNCV_176211 [Trichonephila clavipes]|nr:hypothetical protein TNCV_176211 [Trichonephila clavipes]
MMNPAYNKKGGAAFLSRWESVTDKRPTSFPKEIQPCLTPGFEPEPTRLQAEGHSHHIGWGTSGVSHSSWSFAWENSQDRTLRPLSSKTNQPLTSFDLADSEVTGAVPPPTTCFEVHRVRETRTQLWNSNSDHGQTEKILHHVSLLWAWRISTLREIGSRVGRNQTTVMRIWDCWMQEGTADRRGRSHPPQSDSSLETPLREDAEELQCAPLHCSCIGYYGMGWYWISLSHSSSTHCRYFKQPALHLRKVGASCPSLPSGLGHSHISTG